MSGEKSGTWPRATGMDSAFSPNVEVSVCTGFKILERALLFDRLPGRVTAVLWCRGGKITTGEKTLSQCHFVYHKSHID